MTISLKKIAEKLIWLLTIFLFASFLIFETYTWGKYVIFGATILALFLSAMIYDGILRIRLQAYHVFFALFIGYMALNSLWAMNSADTMKKVNTLMQILLCAALLYIHYDRSDSIESLLSAVRWSGYVVTLYAITFYGLDAMLESSQDIRLENEFSNVNTIAMAAALSCTIQWNDLLKKKSFWSVPLMIPAIILITATQSRKAFVLLLAGVFAVYILRTMEQKGFVKKVLKLITYSLVLLLGLRLLFQLPIFAGSLERMDKLLNFWTKSGDVDNSTVLRNNMMQLGMEWWKKYPILGIGIGNPHILAGRYLKFDTYLHNNFVELLCGGGLVGFLIYYGMYVYLFVGLFKYRKADKEAFAIGVVWLSLMLIMNYGMVTYYSKTQWFYLLVHFINVKNMKTKYREMMKNAQKPVAEGVEVSAGS